MKGGSIWLIERRLAIREREEKSGWKGDGQGWIKAERIRQHGLGRKYYAGSIRQEGLGRKDQQERLDRKDEAGRVSQGG